MHARFMYPGDRRHEIIYQASLSYSLSNVIETGSHSSNTFKNKIN